MNDDLREDQACFKTYQENYGSDKVFAGNHPSLNEVFKSLICCTTQDIQLETLGTIGRQKV